MVHGIDHKSPSLIFEAHGRQIRLGERHALRSYHTLAVEGDVRSSLIVPEVKERIGVAVRPGIGAAAELDCYGRYSAEAGQIANGYDLLVNGRARPSDPSVNVLVGDEDPFAVRTQRCVL